jgi:glycosyltransferase involved in cell wall biosynthesis
MAERARVKVLIVHNSYQQPGGEDVVAGREAALLRQAGHEVMEYRRSNHELRALSPWGKLTFPKQVIWAGESVRDLRALIHEEKPQVAHFHNTFLMISPSAYQVCQEMSIPVVQTLHNYRFLCPRADFFRNGHICEECLGKTPPWPGVVYGCYRGSRAQTAVVATMLTVHRWLKTWDEQVDAYIALTEFARQKFIQGGLPAEKILLKPNFVDPDPGLRVGIGDYALFVGRFSPEEKVLTLLKAWQKIEGIRLKLVGGEAHELRIRQFPGEFALEKVEFLGRRTRDQVFALMKEARLLIFPSEWYEAFPLVLAEAFACGVPVVATRLGAMAEIVEEGRTGLFFTPGDSDDLSAKVQWAFAHPQEMAQMGRRARQEFEAKYTGERNREGLLNIYRIAIGRARERRGEPSASSALEPAEIG